MASVALGLMQVFSLGPGSNIGKGIFITLTYTAGCFDKMVIAGPSTILGRGLIENGAGVHVYYEPVAPRFPSMRSGHDIWHLAACRVALPPGGCLSGSRSGISS